jgi:hypothetical protein
MNATARGPGESYSDVILNIAERGGSAIAKGQSATERPS